MKKGTLAFFSVIMLAAAFSGCAVLEFETESEKKMKEEVKTLKAELSETKEGAYRSQADIVADIEGLRQELASIRGGLEEKDYDTARIKENLELAGSTLQALEGRLKEIESRGLSEEEGKKWMEESIGGLKTSLASLDERLKKLEEKGSSKKETPEEDAMSLYMEALDLVRANRDYEKGLSAFGRFLTLYPGSELSDNAQYWIGEIYYAQGDWEKAVLEFDRVVKRYPQGDKVAASILKQGYSFEKLGAAKEAKILLKKVTEEFPDTPEAELAGKHLKEMEKEGAKDKKR